MERGEEAVFLELLSQHSHVITNKKRSTLLSAQKVKTWEQIRGAFVARTGKNIETKQLQKRYGHMQERLKTKLAKRKGTGGGPAVVLSDNDTTLWEILGQRNPKLAEIPGAASAGFSSAVEEVAEISSDEANEADEADETDDDTPAPTPTTPKSCPSARSSRLTVPQFHELFHLEKSKLLLEIEKIGMEKENLILEKEKLTLEIIKLRQERSELDSNPEYITL